MKLHFVAATALLVLSTSAFADSQFERTFKVAAQPDLFVLTGSGHIHVHPGTDGEIHIVGHVRSGWNAFAGDIKSRIDRIVANPPLTQDGNAVRAGATNDRSLYENITIDYDVTAPASVALNLRTGSGEIETDRLGRYLTATSGSGDIRTQGVHGPAEVSAGSGNIEVGEEGQGDVKAKSGSGNIHIHGLNGGLMARTGSGDIEADGRLTGPASLSSGSGNVRLHLGPDVHFNLEASTGSGDIRIRFPGAPEQNHNSRHHMTAPINGGGSPLEVRTGSGDIEIAQR